MRRALTLLALVLPLAACEPSEPALDGAPSGETGEAVPSSELAGGPPAQDVVLPGVINLATPPGMRVIDNCEGIVAPDYDHPPRMTCLLFQIGDSPTVADPSFTEPAFLSAMSNAGWQFVRALGSERYFERVKAGTDCADLAAVTVLGAQLPALVEHAKAPPAPAEIRWLGYAITASIREACGPDRMRP